MYCFVLQVKQNAPGSPGQKVTQSICLPTQDLLAEKLCLLYTALLYDLGGLLQL